VDSAGEAIVQQLARIADQQTRIADQQAETNRLLLVMACAASAPDMYPVQIEMDKKLGWTWDALALLELVKRGQ
jgi:hypothetical protein